MKRPTLHLTLLCLLLASCTTPEPQYTTNQYGEVVLKTDTTNLTDMKKKKVINNQERDINSPDWSGQRFPADMILPHKIGIKIDRPITPGNVSFITGNKPTDTEHGIYIDPYKGNTDTVEKTLYIDNGPPIGTNVTITKTWSVYENSYDIAGDPPSSMGKTTITNAYKEYPDLDPKNTTSKKIWFYAFVIIFMGVIVAYASIIVSLYKEAFGK